MTRAFPIVTRPLDAVNARAMEPGTRWKGGKPLDNTGKKGYAKVVELLLARNIFRYVSNML